MKVSRVEKLYIAVLMVLFAGIVVHAPLSVWLGTQFPAYELLVKSWKEILMVGIIPLAVVIVSRRGMWRQFAHDWIFHVVVAYALLHVLLVAIFYQGAAATAAGLAIDLRYVLFFGLVYVGVKALPQYRRRLVQIGIVGAFVVVGFATLQFFLPPDILAHIGYSKDTIAPYLTVDKNPDFVRVNSTLRGPNPLGAYAGMVLGLLAAAFLRLRPRLKDKKLLVSAIILAVCSVATLWLSYSRSALVATAIILFVVVGVAAFRTISRRAWVAGVVVACAVVGSVVAGWGSPFVQNVLLHENKSGGSAVSSNEQHAESLAFGFDRMVHQPLGAGVGSTGSASLHSDTAVVIENQYLFVAHETGWIGLALFLALFILVLVRLWHGRQDWLSLGVFAAGIGLGLIGLLQPVWADDTVAIVWWGLAGIALATGGKYGKKTK